jgi:phage terminase large subunit
VIDLLRSWGVPVMEVQFGSTAGIPLGGENAGNKRAEMYLSFRTWLKEGGCIPDHPDVEKQFTAVKYYHSKAKHMKEAILLIPKDEIEEDQDWSDAIAMTFAFPVVAAAWKSRGAQQIKKDYDPLAASALPNYDPQVPSGGLGDMALYEQILRASHQGSVH